MLCREYLFDDRHDAGQKLSRRLLKFATEHPVVLALQHGGVPVAFEVAKALNAELDLLFVREIAAPGFEDLTIGAVIDGASPQFIVNENFLKHLTPKSSYIRAEMRRTLAEIENKRSVYCGGHGPVAIKDRIAIVVDDGMTDRDTVRAALRGADKNDPLWLTLAVPVAPLSVIAAFAQECDEIICIKGNIQLGDLDTVYLDDTQTSDAEVISLLDVANHPSLQHWHAAVE